MAEDLNEWFRRIGTQLSDADYEAGVVAMAQERAKILENVLVEYAGERPDFVVLTIDELDDGLVKMLGAARQDLGVRFLALTPGITLERALTRGNLKRMLDDLEQDR